MPDPVAPNPRGEVNKAVLRDAQRITVRQATHAAATHYPGSVSQHEQRAKQTRRGAAAAAQKELNRDLQQPTRSETIQADARYPGRQSGQREVHIRGGQDLAISHLAPDAQQAKRDLGAQVFEGNRIERQTNWEKRKLAGTPEAGYIAAAQLAETGAATAENISAAAGLFTAADAGITSVVASGIGAAANAGSKFSYNTAARLAAGRVQQIREEANLRNPETGELKSGPLPREQALETGYEEATRDWAHSKSLRRGIAAASDVVGAVTGGVEAVGDKIKQAAMVTGGRLAEVEGVGKATGGITGNVASRSAGTAFEGVNAAEAATTAGIGHISGGLLESLEKRLHRVRNPEASDASKERHFQDRANFLGDEYEGVERGAANVLQSIPGRLRARKFAKVAGEALTNHREAEQELKAQRKREAHDARMKTKRPVAKPKRRGPSSTT